MATSDYNLKQINLFCKILSIIVLESWIEVEFERWIEQKFNDSSVRNRNNL